MSKIDDYLTWELDDLIAFREAAVGSVLHGQSSISFWGSTVKDLDLAIAIKRAELAKDATQLEAVTL